MRAILQSGSAYLDRLQLLLIAVLAILDKTALARKQRRFDVQGDLSVGQQTY